MSEKTTKKKIHQHPCGRCWDISDPARARGHTANPDNSESVMEPLSLCHWRKVAAICCRLEKKVEASPLKFDASSPIKSSSRSATTICCFQQSASLNHSAPQVTSVQRCSFNCSKSASDSHFPLQPDSDLFPIRTLSFRHLEISVIKVVYVRARDKNGPE